jgi:hypothetical protein
MYRDTYIDFIYYFWIVTDYGLLWLASLITLAVLKVLKS